LEAHLNPLKTEKAVLVLEDGSHFFGHGFGAAKKVSGEIVFSTSMVGYPEAHKETQSQRRHARNFAGVRRGRRA